MAKKEKKLSAEKISSHWCLWRLKETKNNNKTNFIKTLLQKKNTLLTLKWHGSSARIADWLNGRKSASIAQTSVLIYVKSVVLYC